MSQAPALANWVFCSQSAKIIEKFITSTVFWVIHAFIELPIGKLGIGFELDGLGAADGSKDEGQACGDHLKVFSF